MRAHPIVWIVGMIVLAGFTESLKLAEPCLPSKCKLPKCKCSTTDSGSTIPVNKIPQIIMSSFDDGVTPVTYEYFSKALFNRTNPDGCPIGITHFLSHEYADYSKVHDLWLRGHEIALHSVSHDAEIEGYWANMNLTTFKLEFDGIKTMANHFGWIPLDSMKGMRLPFLQTSGNVSFQGLSELGLTYDSSLPTRAFVDPPLWPYTLEYASIQDCAITPCPTASFPNVWEIPMIMWFDERNIPCSMVDACVYIPKDAESISRWIIKQFERHYRTNRAPFPLFMHAAWFLKNPENFLGYVKFLDYVKTLPNVYIVTVNKAIEWIKNPKSLDIKNPFGNCTVNTSPKPCKPLTCGVQTADGKERWITSCVSTCPNVYPWLGNPLGEKMLRSAE